MISLVSLLNFEKRLKERAKLRKCKRCDLLFPKTQLECPHCARLSDLEVIELLKKNKRAGLNLAAGMFILAIIIFIVIVLIN